MRKRTLLQAFCLFIALFCFHSSFSYESQDNIKKVAREFLLKNIEVAPGDNIEVQINESHTPFEVHTCAKPIGADFPKNANQEQLTSLEISCNDPTPWHIFVPVDVQIYTKVLVAKRTIAPRETISDEDLDFTVSNKNRLYSGYFTKKEDVVGDIAAHLITAGTILTNRYLQQPLLVHKNQTISIIAQSSAVTVTMQGIAKTDGALNSVIKVLNPSSKQTLDAVVVGPNKAQIVS